MKGYVYPYHPASESAKALGYPRIKHRNSRFRPGANKIIINWGASKTPLVLGNRFLNYPDEVAIAVNKLSFLRSMHLQGLDALVPEWTRAWQMAEIWIREGHKVCIRQKLTGNSGQGLTIAEREDQLVNAPLYTKYIPKREEYRIHVMHNQVVDIQRKARVRALPDRDVNWLIRNHNNGFIFQREGFHCPQVVLDAAVTVMRNTGLHFGACDVVWNERSNQAYVLEVNTAPGIEGTTVNKYREAFRNFYNVE